MANSFGTETPPAPPTPDMGNALTSGAVPMPQGAPPQAAPGAGGAQQGPAPPTHAQTVAALRHFDAIRRELRIIASDPALGKSSVKSQIIDSMTRLVAGRIIKPTEAVTELAKVPVEPLMQMKFVKNMLQQTEQAENGLLDHYGATSPHFGTVAEHFAATQGVSSLDDHHDHMSALVANFKGTQ